MEHFGQRVRAARVAAGLTQLELARAMGYSTRSTISRIESGDNQIPMDRLAALSRALGVTPAYLLGQDAAPAREEPPQDALWQEFIALSRTLRRDQLEMLLRLMRELSAGR